MSACFAQTRGLPANELIEVGLTDLEADPLAQSCVSIYGQLDLSGFAAARAWFPRLSGRTRRLPKESPFANRR